MSQELQEHSPSKDLVPDPSPPQRPSLHGPLKTESTLVPPVRDSKLDQEVDSPEKPEDLEEPCNTISNNYLTVGTSTTGLGDVGKPSQSVAATSPSRVRRRRYDVFVLLLSIIMLLWPWATWGAIFGVKGVKMNNGLAKIVDKHPQTTNFLVTVVGTLIAFGVDLVFTIAVVRLSHEALINKGVPTSLFHVTLAGAFRSHSIQWPWSHLKLLLIPHFWPIFALCTFILTLQFVPSGSTSLLLPVRFDRNETLSGTELDFASTDPGCISWLDEHRLGNECDWREYRNENYTTCLGQNQLLDVLASGRSRMLSMSPNNTESLSLNQLGAKDGMRLLGPLRGILPMGPNGPPAFDRLDNSPWSPSRKDLADGMLSYNYTLNYQGLASNISCLFDPTTPIRIRANIAGESALISYNASCPDGIDFLSDSGVTDVVVPNSNNSFAFWACKAPSMDESFPSYYLYFRGLRNYVDTMGNITCLLSPLQTSVFPTTYLSEGKLFTSPENATSAPSPVYDGLIEQSLVGLVGVAKDAQSYQSNLVHESVVTVGVKSFDLEPHGRQDRYLPLLAAMVQGMLEYEVTYSRLLYSTEDIPPSCIRQIDGLVTYRVIGWEGKLAHIGFLMPMTLVNAASVVFIIIAIASPWKARAPQRHAEEDVPTQEVKPDEKERLLDHYEQEIDYQKMISRRKLATDAEERAITMGLGQLGGTMAVFEELLD
ncbi:hypothetical protein CC1G_02858 [Coprinopsis cinerea okayama7|uniref:Uncharacterized protein n=1 Tax=Coprinopsis cinerea (strain Okayama-7 / 130 / ATCC MYA-4618 / FGSC 9003) TaxID=240176 RepID=A8N089_COPC7|nr:hypothetical protein CC1G_02858 [Coprinopsis cinerea okayama7\|eukprot:XP_001828277.2 hypothetical protein CC1G_02858 [Coprinopsis cinerea okayama7\